MPWNEEFSSDFDSVYARWREALITRFEPLGIAPDCAAALADLTTTEALIRAIGHDAASSLLLPEPRPAG